MHQYIKLFLLIFLITTIKCKQPLDPLLNNGVKTFFYLADSTGKKETKFNIGEDIYFHYLTINNSHSTYDYVVSNSGPIVTFEVFHNDSLIGTSDDEFCYLQVIVYGKLTSKDTLKYTVSWLSNEYHSMLHTGKYTAKAKSNLYIRLVICLFYTGIHRGLDN